VRLIEEVFFASRVIGTPVPPGTRYPTLAMSPRSFAPFFGWRSIVSFSSASRRYSVCRISNAAPARLAELRLRPWARLSVAIVAPPACRRLRPRLLTFVADEVLGHAHRLLGRHALWWRGRLLGLRGRAGGGRCHELQGRVVLLDK